MENPTGKFYLASTSAIRKVGENDYEINHYPMLIPNTAHITGAALAAQQVAFAKFPTSDGWMMHDAYVMPITNQFIAMYHTLQTFLDAGLVIEDDPLEFPERFTFASPTSPPNPK